MFYQPEKLPEISVAVHSYKKSVGAHETTQHVCCSCRLRCCQQNDYSVHLAVCTQYVGRNAQARAQKVQCHSLSVNGDTPTATATGQWQQSDMLWGRWLNGWMDGMDGCVCVLKSQSFMACVTALYAPPSVCVLATHIRIGQTKQFSQLSHGLNICISVLKTHTHVSPSSRASDLRHTHEIHTFMRQLPFSSAGRLPFVDVSRVRI